jgi:uncharacterized protein YjiS (DUF1127 family)
MRALDRSWPRPVAGRLPLPLFVRGTYRPTGLASIKRLATAAWRCGGLFWARIDEWRRRARSRHDLMRLGDRELWDVRLTRADADGEASKPFWKK